MVSTQFTEPWMELNSKKTSTQLSSFEKVINILQTINSIEILYKWFYNNYTLKKQLKTIHIIYIIYTWESRLYNKKLINK
jgi:hypothetical protein